MADKTYILDVPITGTFEERDGYWVSHNDQFHIVTYGATADEAKDRTKLGLGMISEYLWRKGGPDALRRWLDRAGASYSLRPAEEAQVSRYQEVERRELAAV